MDTENAKFDVVVVGAGPVGMHVARGLASHLSVLVIDADPDSPDGTEGRAQLLQRLAEGTQSLASLQSPVVPANIEYRATLRIEALDRDRQAVIAEHGERIGYTHLVLALGASPVIPPLDGGELANVQKAYSRHEVRAIARSATRGESIVIVGGGLLAIELAAAIATTARVTLLARSRLLRKYAGPVIGRRVASHLLTLGVVVVQECELVRLQGDRRVDRVLLRDGRMFEADRVVLACGMRPNIQLARAAGLCCPDGIRVDDDMGTSDRHVFAVGDCARPPSGHERGNVTLGIQQAKRVIGRLLGRAPPIGGQRTALTREVRLGELKFLSMAPSPDTAAAATQRIGRRCGRRAFEVTLRADKIVAYQALLPGRPANRLTQLAAAGAALSPIQRLRLFLGMVPPADSSADAVVCHCAGVSRRMFLQAVTEQGADLDAACRATGAGHYCGGCRDELAVLIGGDRSVPRWLPLTAAATVFALVVLIAWLPSATPGDSVRTLWFETYALLTTSSVRQASGYLSLLFIALALVATRPSRSGPRWLHSLFGALAVAVLPLHTLGGMGVGAGLNGVLVGILLLCVLLGVPLLLRRSLSQLLWLHTAAGVVLLAAVAIHVVDIYQY